MNRFLAGTIYEGTTNIQLSTMAKMIDQEYDGWNTVERDMNNIEAVVLLFMY